ncbi:hypothetical protein GN956_G17448 [Arapaima gigas]
MQLTSFESDKDLNTNSFTVQSPVYCGNLGDHPCSTTCTNCHQRITARVTYKPGIFSWVICVVFVIFGLICGCCLIPFFVESFQDAHHSCPLCSAHLHHSFNITFAAATKKSNMASEQNMGNKNVNVTCTPTSEEPTTKSPPPPQIYHQPQYVPQPQVEYQPQVVYQPQVQYQQPAVHIVHTQPQAYVSNGNFGEHPCQTTCANCHQRITTRVIYKAGVFSWVICFVFVIFGLICGCCLIPFFVEVFQDAHHSCPLCNAHLHVHKKI